MRVLNIARFKKNINSKMKLLIYIYMSYLLWWHWRDTCQNLIFFFNFRLLDHSRIWTSADACSGPTDLTRKKCNSATWCSTGEVLNTTRAIPLAPFGGDWCLAYERTAGRFSYKPCRSRFYFICEVNNLKYFLINKEFLFVYVQHPCVEAYCPSPNRCVVDVR